MKYQELQTALRKKSKRWFLKGFLIILTVIFITYLGLITWIKLEANTMAKQTSVEFQTGKTEALIAIIDSENYSLKEKNNAIWALGVLKDKDALPKLESMITGKECNHETEVCQYEINKAILKIKGEFIGSWQASR